MASLFQIKLSEWHSFGIVYFNTFEYLFFLFWKICWYFNNFVYFYDYSKVYAILTAQLAVTGFFILLFVANTGSTQFVARNPYLIWIALGVTIVTLLALTCCESVARATPTNYIFLFVFTIAEGFLLGVTSAKFGPQQVKIESTTRYHFK